MFLSFVMSLKSVQRNHNGNTCSAMLQISLSRDTPFHCPCNLHLNINKTTFCLYNMLVCVYLGACDFVN